MFRLNWYMDCEGGKLKHMLESCQLCQLLDERRFSPKLEKSDNSYIGVGINRYKGLTVNLYKYFSKLIL